MDRLKRMLEPASLAVWAPPGASTIPLLEGIRSGGYAGRAFVLGGGSNLVITGDIKPLVVKVEIGGRRLVEETPRGWLVEAGAGENWHDLVRWTLEQGWPGLENLALIPGSVGASP
eukprot:gene20212-28598_t